MNPEIIKYIIDLAKFYPSGDNAQPFRFKFNKDNVLTIAINPSQKRDSFLINRRPYVISLGALLEYLSNAAAIYGYKTNEEILIEEFPMNQKMDLVKVRFEKTPQSIHFDKEHLLNRTTDRRHFTAKLSDADFENIQKELQLNYVDLILENSNEELKDYICQSEASICYWKEAVEDVTGQINFFHREATGMPIANIAFKVPDWIGLFCLKYFSLFRKFAVYTGFPMVMEMDHKKAHKKSSRLLFTHKATFNLHEEIIVAKETCRVWLHLNKLGYGFQPCTLSTYYMNEFSLGTALEKALGFKFRRLKSLGQSLVSKYIPFQDHKVFWIARVGKQISPLPGPNRTNRLNTEDVLELTNEVETKNEGENHESSPRNILING